MVGESPGFVVRSPFRWFPSFLIRKSSFSTKAEPNWQVHSDRGIWKLRMQRRKHPYSLSCRDAGPILTVNLSTASIQEWVVSVLLSALKTSKWCRNTPWRNIRQLQPPGSSTSLRCLAPLSHTGQFFFCRSPRTRAPTTTLISPRQSAPLVLIGPD